MSETENVFVPKNSKELIKEEIDKLIQSTKISINDLQKFAISEVWRILQLAIAATIQIIEIIGNDLSSPEKKELAMNLISNFYDNIFFVVDIPGIPNFIEPYLHKYTKAFIMILVSSSIDSMVRIFRDVGVFKSKLKYQGMFPI